jgi:carbon-monoxide dehydrogenase medium subunit
MTEGPMLFSEPNTIDEAITQLAADDGAKCFSGGATLVAMLNAGLVQPTRLVSLANIAELQGIAVTPDGRVRIGAMTSHATVARDRRLVGGLGLVREAAAQIAHPAIRNMGTIGGAVAHADPSSDYPGALMAAGAEVEIACPHGRRTCAIDDLFVDYLTSALEPGEVITGVVVPAPMPGERSAYVKFSRVDGDYATVSVGVRLTWADDACAAIRIAVGSCGPVPIRVPDAERSLVGTRLDDDALRSAAQAYVDATDPIDDLRGTAEYRLMLIPGLIERAVRGALAGLPGASA